MPRIYYLFRIHPAVVVAAAHYERYILYCYKNNTRCSQKLLPTRLLVKRFAKPHRNEHGHPTPPPHLPPRTQHHRRTRTVFQQFRRSLPTTCGSLVDCNKLAWSFLASTMNAKRVKEQGGINDNNMYCNLQPYCRIVNIESLAAARR